VSRIERLELSSGLQAAKAKLQMQESNQDLNAEVDAQRDIARLGYEEARLIEAKSAMKICSTKTRTTENPNINLNRSIEPELDQIPKQSLGELKTSGLVLIQL
jgi:hypothetical protein